MQLTFFDRLILAILIGLIAFTTLVAWRGDQVGAQVDSNGPANNATVVPTQAFVRVTFAQEMDTTMLERPVILPGQTRFRGNSSLVGGVGADTAYLAKQIPAARQTAPQAVPVLS